MISIGYKGLELQIFIDLEGIKELKKSLNLLEEKKDTHVHLMTPAWGGYELSEKYFNNGELINQVLLQRIPEE